MKNVTDEITVIIPTYNRSAMLRRALESVLQETRVPIQAHVFDNASTDGTDDYLKEMVAADPRIVVTRNDENIGATANYIKAFASIQSTLFVPLADDDWLLPDFLFNAYGMLAAHPDAAAAVFFAKAINEDNVTHGTYPITPDAAATGYLSPTEHIRSFMKNGHYLWSSVLWKTETRDHLGYPFFHTNASSDVDYQVQVFAKFPVVVSPNYGAVYCDHPTQHSALTTMEEIPHWADFFDRVDACAAPLLDHDEYQALRQGLVERYKGSWQREPKTALEQKKLLRLAVLSGECLNDIPTMAKLVSQIDINTAQPDVRLNLRLLQNVTEFHSTHVTELNSLARRLQEENQFLHATLANAEKENLNLRDTLEKTEQESAQPTKAIKKMFRNLNRARKNRRTTG